MNLSNNVASNDEDTSGITGKNDEVAGHGHVDGLEERGEEAQSNSANISHLQLSLHLESVLPPVHLYPRLPTGQPR